MSAQLENVTIQTPISENTLKTMSNNQNQQTPDNISMYSKNRITGPEAGTSYEVFRNNTTAVEVIVKDVPQRRRRTKTTLNNYNHTNESRTLKLEEEIENLKIDLNRANTKFVLSRKGFTELVTGLQNQLETVSRREIDAQYVNIKLKMENEKLKTQLESKSKLANKLKKELVGMQRLLKYIVKWLKFSPGVVENCSMNSDTEYDDFEKGLKNEARLNFAPNVFDVLGANVTFEGNLSRNMNSF